MPMPFSCSCTPKAIVSSPTQSRGSAVSSFMLVYILTLYAHKLFVRVSARRWYVLRHQYIRRSFHTPLVHKYNVLPHLLINSLSYYKLTMSGTYFHHFLGLLDRQVTSFGKPSQQAQERLLSGRISRTRTRPNDRFERGNESCPAY